MFSLYSCKEAGSTRAQALGRVLPVLTPPAPPGERVGPLPPDAHHHAGLPPAELHLQRFQQYTGGHDRGVPDRPAGHRQDPRRRRALGPPLSAAHLLRQVQVSER